MTATNFPEFNAAVTELTTKVSNLLGDVATMQSVTTGKLAEAAAIAESIAASETAVAASESSAATSSAEAMASETAATLAAEAAAASAASIAGSVSIASTKADEASSSAASAAASAASIGESAAAASTKADQAASSATDASASATSAADSAATASTKADQAASSATDAAASAASAADSAATASTKADQAASSATDAAASSSSAQSAKASAESARENAQIARAAAEEARDRAELAASSLTGNLVEYGGIDLSGGVYPIAPNTAGFWKVTVAGVIDSIEYGVGDTLVYSKNLGQFYKIDNTESVTSVNGKTGSVSVTAADLGLGSVDNTPDTSKPVSSAQQAALDGKVDKESGKALMTDAERSKLSGIAAGAQVNVATNLGQGTRTSTGIPLTSSTGAGTTLPIATTVLAGLQSAADKAKLDGIAAGATANATDEQLRDRGSHTGEQAISTIAGLSDALAAKQDSLVSGANLKTINGESLLGEGDVVIEGGGGSGGGLTLFEESRNTASPNATVPVHALTALGAETDIDFVIAPKGTGAIIAQIPDGTVAGGNKRGAGAVDLQLTRTSANQVASGANSFVAGRNNRVSGAAGVAIGSGCTASGVSIAMGSSSTASGSFAVAMGSSASATGGGSIALGSSTIASGGNSVALGSRTNTRGISGAVAEGLGPELVSPGRQQMSRIPLRFDTPDGSPTQLSSDGAEPNNSNSAVMPSNSAYYCRLRVLARNTATNESKSWSGTALIKRGANAASTTLIGSSLTSDFGDAAMSACTVTLSADTTRGALAVTVTGLVGATVRWVAQLETVEAA